MRTSSIVKSQICKPAIHALNYSVALKDLRWSMNLRDVFQIILRFGKPFVDYNPLNFYNKPFPYDKGDT